MSTERRVMNRWMHAQKHLLRTLLATAAILASAAGLHAEPLTSAPPAKGPGAVATAGFVPLGATPDANRGRSTPDAKARLRSVYASLVQLHEDLVRELVATQLAL